MSDSNKINITSNELTLRQFNKIQEKIEKCPDRYNKQIIIEQNCFEAKDSITCEKYLECMKDKNKSESMYKITREDNESVLAEVNFINCELNKCILERLL